MFWIIDKLITWFCPDFILIPKDQFLIPAISSIAENDDNIKALVDYQLYGKVLSLVRNIESSGSLGQYKRINVITAIKAECRKLDLPEWPERDINLAIEIAIREL